jgi:hypothetical protein
VKRDLGRVGDAAPTYHLADDNDDGNHDDTDKAD